MGPVSDLAVRRRLAVYVWVCLWEIETETDERDRDIEIGTNKPAAPEIDAGGLQNSTLLQETSKTC